MESPKTSLSPELLEKARLELNEDWTKVPDQIKSLRARILEDPKRNFRTDDAFLLRFLRARKFDENRTLELMTNYYKQRAKNPQFFSRTCADLKNALDSKYLGILPNRDSDGAAIIVLNSISYWNPDAFSLEDIFANFVLSLERLIEDEDVQVCGIVGLGDMKGLNLKHFFNINPLVMKRALSCVVHSFPIRYKAIHYVNEPMLFDAVFRIIKPFFGKKLLSRIQFHGKNLENLHQQISVDVLPEEFGGNAGPYDNELWNDVLMEHQETSAQNLKFGLVS